MSIPSMNILEIILVLRGHPSGERRHMLVELGCDTDLWPVIMECFDQVGNLIKADGQSLHNYVAFWVDDDGMIGPVFGFDTKPEGVEYCKKHASQYNRAFSEEQIADLYEHEESVGPGLFNYHVHPVEKI